MVGIQDGTPKFSVCQFSNSLWYNTRLCRDYMITRSTTTRRGVRFILYTSVFLDLFLQHLRLAVAKAQEAHTCIFFTVSISLGNVPLLANQCSMTSGAH